MPQMPTDKEGRRMHSPRDIDAERGIFDMAGTDEPKDHGNMTGDRKVHGGGDGGDSVFGTDDLSFDDELDDLEAKVGKTAADSPSSDAGADDAPSDDDDDPFAEYRFSELPFERVARVDDTGTWGSFDVDAPLHLAEDDDADGASKHTFAPDEGPEPSVSEANQDEPDTDAEEVAPATMAGTIAFDGSDGMDSFPDEDVDDAAHVVDGDVRPDETAAIDDGGDAEPDGNPEQAVPAGTPDRRHHGDDASTGVTGRTEHAMETSPKIPHEEDGQLHPENDLEPDDSLEASVAHAGAGSGEKATSEQVRSDDGNVDRPSRKPRGLRVHAVPSGTGEGDRAQGHRDDGIEPSGMDGMSGRRVTDSKPSLVDRLCSHLPSAVSVVLMAVLVLIGVLAVSEAYDNDQWFIIATGRHIVETLSVPMENPFSIHEGMRTVIQQWLPSVWTYLSFDRFGEAGIFGVVAVEIAVLLGCLYVLGRQAKRSSTSAAVLLLMVPTMMTLTAYISIRPQIITMVMMTLTLIVMERYRKGGNAKVLIWLPVIAMAHANLHASMAPMDLAIVGCYLVPDLPALARRALMWYRDAEGRLLGRTVSEAPYRHSTAARSILGTPGGGSARDGWGRRRGTDRVMTGTPLDGLGFRESSYPRLPLLAALAAMCLAMCVNPYGIDGALYLAHSYGAADYGSYISEMGRLTPASSTWGMMSIAMLVLGAMGAGRNGTRRIDFPLTVAMLVCGYVGFQHVRNVWLAAIFAFLLAAKAFGDARVDLGRTSITKLPAFATCIAVVVAFTPPTLATAAKEDVESDTRSVPKVAMDWLDSHMVDKDTAKVFSFFNAGGYIEYRGYKVEMDPRPELWEPGITKLDSHWYHEFVDAATGSIDIKEMVERYDFDYLVVDTGSALYNKLQNDPSYRIVADGNAYALWQHLRDGADSSSD